MLKSKDPMIAELQAICETRMIVPVTFMEANRREANFGLDAIADLQFPVLIYITSKGSENELGENGEWTRNASIYAMLLDKYDQATMDAESKEVNSTIYRIYRIAQNLMYLINKSPLSVAGGVDSFTSDEVYAEMDANLYGLALSFKWSISTGVTGYLNPQTI